MLLVFTNAFSNLAFTLKFIKMGVCTGRVADYRRSFERFTKEEVLELCEEIMKEAAYIDC